MPVLLHSLRSPVSKSALKMTLAEAESITQNRLADKIKGSEYPSSAFDFIWMSRGKVSRLPVCHRGEELGERQTPPPILVILAFWAPSKRTPMGALPDYAPAQVSRLERWKATRSRIAPL